MNKQQFQRRLIVSILLLALLTVASCGGAASPAPATQAPATQAAGPTKAALPAGTKPLRVVFLIIQPFGTPFEGDVWNGIVRAKEDGYASEIKLIEFKEPSEYESGVRAVSEEGWDVVVGTFEILKPAFEKVAPDFPNTKYVNVWVTAPEPASKYPNVRGYVYNVEEGSYLNGVMAAMMSPNHRVGFIGGDDNAVILRFLAGFEAGVKATDPNTQIDISWAGTFIDPVKGRELAISLYQRGVDSIMTASNKTGLGVIVAGQELDKPVFGVDIDQSKDAPKTVISSALANAGESAYRSIVDAATNKWTGGTIYFGADDGLNTVAINSSYGIPQNVLDAVKKAQDDIASGKIKVPETTDTR
jgi:basic membrane protein A